MQVQPKTSYMNDETTTPSLPGFEAAVPDESGQPAKVRKPRARKPTVPAADAAAAEASPQAALPSPADGVDAAAPAEDKPKRARRPRKAAEALPPVAQAPEAAAAAPVAAVAVAAPAEVRSIAPSAEGAPRSAGGVPEAAESGVGGEGADGSAGEGEAAAGGDERQAGTGKRRRKLRSKYGVGGGSDRHARRRDDAGAAPGQDAAEGDVPGAEAVTLIGEDSAVQATLFSDVISGQFDADEADEEVSLPKRVLQPQPETPKLHKVLAQAGMGSRLEMEQMIADGRISVNDEPAHVGQRIQFGDQIRVDGKPIRFRIAPPAPRVLAYHKPVGEVVTHDDPQNRPTVFRRLPKLYQGKWQSVGRLDLNTEGLLLFTSSGELANRLMHPRFGLQREYAVRVLGALSNEEKQQLLDGVRLDDGVAQFQSIEEGGGDGANCWYRVTIAEGRNREVRRMLEAVGHAVSRLIRIRYGVVVLPRGLKRGAWMELGERDVQALTQASGGPLSSDDIRTARADAPQRGNRQGQQGKQGQSRGRANNNKGAGGSRQAGAAPERFESGRSNGGPASPNGAPRNQGPRPADAGKPPRSAKNNRGRDRDRERDVDRDPDQPRGEKQPTADAYMQSHSLAQIRGRRRSFGNDGLPGGRGNGGQPDPMRTSVGYIGSDGFSPRPSRGGFGGGGGGNGPRRGGGGGGGRGGKSR